ncbi:MAG TPA: BON domain-containing protein [Pyrinomonadaceae bacterium]
MAYEEEQHKRSRVVIETPAGRREVVQTVAAHVPERRGIAPGIVAALVIGSVALVTILFLFILNRRDDDSATTSSTRTTTTSAAAQPQQPVVIQQPTPQQAPIIIQQPAPIAEQPPIIIQQPAPAVPEPAVSSSSGSDDTAIRSQIDKKMAEDATLSTVAVTATVTEGKVTLIGTVDTQALKDRIERLVKVIRGVRDIDNQIIVSGG